jgi:membrane protease YdiL (CAAX protease family)
MKTIKTYPLTSFFILAFTITWTLQLTGIVLASQQGMTLSNETNFLHFIDLLKMKLPPEQVLAYVLFTLGMGPLISAVLVTSITEGKDGLKKLWQQCTKWKVNVKWYLAALGLPVLLSVASAGIGWLASGGELTYTFKLPVGKFIPFFLYMLIFTGITEEPGWRGFALPRLQSRYNAEKASWILGILWGVWHFPFIIYYTYNAGIVPLLFSFLGLTLGIVGWTIVNTWLYNNTSSVLIMILLHGWGNAVQSYLVLSSNDMTAQSLYGILPWVIAIILIRIYGKENLSHHPRPQIL